MRGAAGQRLALARRAPSSTTNDDDILFQTTGGATANVGFFDNVGDTRRAGIELEPAAGARRLLTWSVEYSYIDATFEDAFVVNSPNHPVPEQDPDGRRLPARTSCWFAAARPFPASREHQRQYRPRLCFTIASVSAPTWCMRSGVFLRGDEATCSTGPTSYAMLNLRGDLSDR